MADFTTIYVVGRIGLTAADGIDPGDDPDTLWADEGVVRFVPANTYTKVAAGAAGSPISWEGGQAALDMAVDPSGYLSLSGVRRARFIDLTNGDVVNPTVPPGKATHLVQYRNVKARGTAIAFPSVPLRIAADQARPIATADEAEAIGLPIGTMICVLSELTPVPTAGGTPIVRGEQGVGIAGLAVEGSTLRATMTNGDELTTDLPAPLLDDQALVRSTVSDDIDTDGTDIATKLDARIAGSTIDGGRAS